MHIVASASERMEAVGAESEEVDSCQLTASTLCEVGQILADVPSLKIALRESIRTLTHRHPSFIHHASVLLGETDRAQELVERTQRRSRRVRDAAVVSSEVIRTGQTMIVRHNDVEHEARSGRTAPLRLALTQIAIPIRVDGHVVGALSVDVPSWRGPDQSGPVTPLTLIATMLAQAIACSKRIEEQRQGLLDENVALRAKLTNRDRIDGLIGTSRHVTDLRTQIARVAPTNTTVLLRGESGTGKGLIAQMIHQQSTRARRPFITVSCPTLPSELIESELFGYEKGAFTGAVNRKKGRFEIAEGGTLFLDEIGELEVGLQVKLLRVLQEREFERVGGTASIPCDVRIIAATNKKLESALTTGEFREDLYYRLNVFTIYALPLRERQADLLLLADHFLEQFGREHHKDIRRISTPAIDMLTRYHWPGNIRELANVIERAVVVCDRDVIHAHHLPPTLQTAESSGTAVNRSLEELVAAVERDALQDALKSSRGDRAAAARLLRTTRRIFNYKVERYGIDWQRFRV